MFLELFIERGGGNAVQTGWRNERISIRVQAGIERRRWLGKMRIPTRCPKFEMRLAGYFEGGADSEVDEHLAHCSDCREALDNSRLAGDLLRQAWAPICEPRQGFRPTVWAKIREEESHVESAAAFWSPIEFLAFRLALTAAVVLLIASLYLVESAPHRTPRSQVNRTELGASDFPQPPRDPVSNEEVLQSLAERNDGH